MSNSPPEGRLVPASRLNSRKWVGGAPRVFFQDVGFHSQSITSWQRKWLARGTLPQILVVAVALVVAKACGLPMSNNNPDIYGGFVLHQALGSVVLSELEIIRYPFSTGEIDAERGSDFLQDTQPASDGDGSPICQCSWILHCTVPVPNSVVPTLSFLIKYWSHRLLSYRRKYERA